MADASVEVLVATVKDLQRKDPAAKEQWGIYCEQYGGGLRDPAKHPFDFISNFLSQFNSGFRYDALPPKVPKESYGNIADLFKEGQRKSHNWKTAWAAYCQIYGGGTSDPNKHEVTFLVSFLDFLGQQGYNALAPAAGAAAVSSPPAKRVRTGEPALGSTSGSRFSSPLPAATGGGDPALVQRIKNYQRMGQAHKEAWWSFCETNLGGVRDPARHDSNALQSFIQSHGVP